jgi:glucose/arabinose dehydrogenase
VRRNPNTVPLRTIAALFALGAVVTSAAPGHAVSAPNPATSNEGTKPVADIPVKLTRVARTTGGTSLAFRRRDPNLYLARQQGQVVPITRGKVGAPILDVSDRLGSHREQGLLGLAFSPTGRHAYVYFTSAAGENILEEYLVTHRNRPPVRFDASSRRTLLVVPHERPQHNGGQLAFGRDRMLYVGIGDGGGHRGMGPGQVPGGNSQSLDNLLGKILRIDPTPSGERPYTVPATNPFSQGGGAPEIWHYGLRNPWRFSFDRKTGALWIGDVGQDHWEEINTVPAHAAGRNFGYPMLEGTHPLNATSAPGTVAPVFELWHRSGNCAVTGGFVYRGDHITDLRGLYVFADYCKGDIKVLRARSGRAVGFGRLGLHVPLVSSFAEDPSGELYVISQAKGVLRIDRL